MISRVVLAASGAGLLALTGWLMPEGQHSLPYVVVTLAFLALLGWRDFAKRFSGGVLPLVIVILALGAMPGLLSVVVALFDVTSANLTAGGWRFIGLERAVAILGNGDEREIIARTFAFAAICVVLQFALGVPWGLVVARKRQLDWTDGLLLLPVVVPTIVSAMVWRAAFDGSYGAIGRIVRAFGAEPPRWFSLLNADPSTTAHELLPAAMLPAIVAEVWQWTPFVAIVSALCFRQVPEGLVQWSKATAASTPRRLLVAEVPLVGRLILLVAILRLLDSLKAFETVWAAFGNGVLTATSSVRIRTYALETRDYTSAAVLSAILLLMVVALTGLATPYVLSWGRRKDG